MVLNVCLCSYSHKLLILNEISSTVYMRKYNIITRGTVVIARQLNKFLILLKVTYSNTHKNIHTDKNVFIHNEATS